MLSPGRNNINDTDIFSFNIYSDTKVVPEQKTGGGGGGVGGGGVGVVHQFLTPRKGVDYIVLIYTLQ